MGDRVAVRWRGVKAPARIPRMRLAPLVALLLLAGCAGASSGSSTEALCAGGLRQLSAGRPAEAEEAFTRALAEDPAMAKAYWERGRLRTRQGNLEGARQDLGRWLEYDPKYALVRADWDLLLFRDAERESRRMAEEAAARRAEAEGSPLAAFRHFAAAYALTVEPEQEDALADSLIRCWQSTKPRPGYPPALKTFLARAQFLAGEGNHEEAAAAYRQAARFCPWCAEAHLNEGLILGEYQRYPEAIRAMRRALALLPQGLDAQEAEGMLLTWEMLGS